MKKLLIIALFPVVAHAQQRGHTIYTDSHIYRDSIKFDTAEVKMIQRNQLLIQQLLHTVHIDGLLRDKADSIYMQSEGLIQKKLSVKKPQPIKK